MDVIKIDLPTTWEGEDNPSDYMCLLSLREAIKERAACVGMFWYCPPILPYLPYNRQVMASMRNILYDLIPYFVNHEYKDYEDDFSDYPKMWSVSDLVTAEHNIALMPSPGSLSEAWVDWLKAMKYVICKLTHIRYNKYRGEIVEGQGDVHDPPFEEANSESIKKALEGKEITKFKDTLPWRFVSWSGNTHYYHDKQKDPKDGYCGHAEFSAIHITQIVPPRKDMKFNILFKVFVITPRFPCKYSDELEKSVFVGVGGIKEGINDLSYSYSGDGKLNIWFGSDTIIPQNTNKPHSNFRDEDNDSPTIRRSTKIGFEAKICGSVLDLSPGLNFK